MADAEPKYRYDASLAQDIELKWQKFWDDNGTFDAANAEGELTDNQGKHADGRTPYSVISMFPFPSGKGLHVGHPLGYIATDMMARYHRMKGENVMHAIGYDAFGLPAEQYAVQTGQHPRVTTQQNIANMSRQLHRMGLSFDQRRTFATTDYDYVRWTQFIFSKIFDSWYDPDYQRADGGLGSARPIAELENKFRSGEKAIPGFEDKRWDELTKKQKSDVLNDFRLAYVSKSPVNWAPGLGTVLSNEEVTADGRSERGNFPVFHKQLRQWSMRITAYGDRLAKDLDMLDWPDKVKQLQRNWIGESHGASVNFAIYDGEGDQVLLSSQSGSEQQAGSHGKLTVYTTRPDTIFAVTFVVVSPEHDLITKAADVWPQDTPEEWKSGFASPREAVQEYRKNAERVTAADRQNATDKKTGVFTGLYAQNPVTGVKVPVFTADYVLMDYGTGAIMAVPGGDQRDYDFAQAHGLPVVSPVKPAKPVVNEQGEEQEVPQPYVSHDGVMINSRVEETPEGDSLDINGLSVEEGAAKVIDWLEEHEVGEGTVSYRLRDWLFSRQRYWGEPFPVVYDDEEIPYLLPDSALPVKLPEVPDYKPRTFDPDDADSSPEAPLSRNPQWVNVKLDLGDGEKVYHRDTNTMPNWAGSCWYYLRYLDPKDTKALIDPAEDAYWVGPNHNKTAGKSGGIDLYVGGVEHAVLHLLYARFWHKVLFDLGIVSSPEPFHKLFNQGYIQAYAYTDERGQYVPAAEVQQVPGSGQHGEEPEFTWNGEKVNREFGKMGKSLKNIVTPDYMYETYGADTFRVYEMSMGPLADSRPWNTKDVTGSQRFLQRLWRNVVDEQTGEVTVSDAKPDAKLARLLNSTIASVTEEMEGMRPNTAIAKLIVLNNAVTGMEAVPRAVIEPLVLMLSPIAPHIAEELWSKLGHTGSIAYVPWPVADEKLVGEETVTAIVQVAGKVRGKLEVPKTISAEELEKQALALENVQKFMGDVPPRKVIVRAPKVVSIVPGNLGK